MARPRRPAVMGPRPGRAIGALHVMVFALALLSGNLSGCLPPQAGFNVGLGTTEIRGLVELPGESSAPGPALIIAYKHHHKFTALDNEPAITHPSAHVTKAGPAGEYSVSVPADVIRVDLLFVSPGRLTDVFRFRRQLGIGTVTYRARLAPIADWRDHFHTFLEPELGHLIANTQFALSPRDVETLAGWMADQKAHFAATPAAKPPVPEPFSQGRR